MHGRTHLPHSIQTVSAESPIHPPDLRANTIPTIRPSSFRMEGDLLLVDGRPFFVRGIQARGEDWSYLKQLGFNTLQLSDPVTATQIQEAEQLGLWLIAPPPAAWKGGDLGHPYRRVLAWDLGNHLTSRDLTTFRHRANAVRNSDGAIRRPILCGCDSDLAAFDEVADILFHHREPIGSSYPLEHYRGWLASRSSFALAGTPHWSMIQTEPLPSIVSQARAFGRTESEIEETLYVSADEMESLALSSIATGMRGLLFASHERLDSSNLLSRSRATALRALNLKLTTIEPWIAGGHIAAREIGDAHAAPTMVLRTERSWLILPADSGSMSDKPYSSAHQSFPVAKLANVRRVPEKSARESARDLTIPGIPAAIDVFQFQPTGLGRLRHERTAGGVRLEDQQGMHRMLLLTRDPLVVQHIHQKLAQRASIASELQRRLTEDQYLRTDRLLRQLNRSNERLAPIAESIAACDRLLLTKSYDEIHSNCAEAMQTLRVVRDQVARELAPAVHNTPWKEHLEAALWKINVPQPQADENERLPTGQFEDLFAMRDAGWKNWEHAPDWVTTNVTLSADRPREGERFLRLTTEALGPPPVGVPAKAGTQTTREPTAQLEKPPVWITSPKVAFSPGTLVVIRGWIRMPQSPTHCHDGVLLFDSVGGPSLATRVNASPEWQPFSNLRAVDESGEVSVTLALTGVGQVDLDGLSIREVQR